MITNEQFKEFEDVRVGGKYNMFDPNARYETSLTKEEWIEIMELYGTLKERHDEAINNKTKTENSI